MTERHDLQATLRRLKLSGMLDTLDARVAQARAGELGHIEVLCEDERSRRSAKALSRRINHARFETESTIEGYDFNFNTQIPTAQIRDLATCKFIEAGESILLHGPVGVGKTHVAQALGHLACRRDYSVAFTKCSRLLADLAGGRADGTWEARLRRHARADLLIIDDFGMRDFTLSQADDLYELISERHTRRSSLIITSNRAPADWYALFANPVVAEGMLDRLINNAHHILMQGRSYRPNKRPGSTPSTPPSQGGETNPADATKRRGRTPTR